MSNTTKNILIAIYLLFLALPMTFLWVFQENIGSYTIGTFIGMSFAFGFGALGFRAFYKVRSGEWEFFTPTDSRFIKKFKKLLMWMQAVGGFIFCSVAIITFLLTFMDEI